MVTLVTMAECRSGNHEKCPGGISAPRGEFGGAICECSCHSKPYDPGVWEKIEHSIWGRIKDSDDPGEFELYLLKYPKGVYAELARKKLAALGKE